MNSYVKASAAVVLIVLAASGLLVVGNIAVPAAHDPLGWTPERYAEDWPVPPRSETRPGAPDVLLVRGDDTHWDADERGWEGLEYVDPSDDVGWGFTPAIDIREVRGPGPGLASYSIELFGGVPLPRSDPTVRWLAYGIVVDTDEDGLPDERVGVDNMPDGQHRAWWADLATGQTKWKAGAAYGSVYDNGVSGGFLGLDTWYPSADEESDGVILRYSGTPGRYYAWASMIENGRVVTTDYAPDVGWLLEPDDPGLPLVGTTWITEREFNGGSLTAMMSLTFTSDGDLRLDLCQRGTARVEVTKTMMRVGAIALAGDRCNRAEVNGMEAGILAVLSAGELSYTLDAGMLELRAGSTVLRFAGSPAPQPRP